MYIRGAELKLLASKFYGFLSKHKTFTIFMTSLPGYIISIAGILPNIDKFQWLFKSDSTDAKFFKDECFVVLFVSCLCSWLISWFWNHMQKNDIANSQMRTNMYKRLKDGISIYNKEYHDVFQAIVKAGNYQDDTCRAMESAALNTSSRLNSVFRLNTLLNTISEMLTDIFGLEKKEITISIIHKKENEDNWEILANNNSIDGEMNLDELLSCMYSTYRATLSSGTKQILCMNKAEGHAQGIYLPTSKEIEEGMYGSIYCRDLSLYKGNQIVRGFMISIATYNTAFGSPKDPHDVNICQEVFDDIVNFIKPELATICLLENINISGYLNPIRKESEKNGVKIRIAKKRAYRPFCKAKYKNIKKQYDCQERTVI